MVPVTGPGRPGGPTGHRIGPVFFGGGSTGDLTGPGFFGGVSTGHRTGFCCYYEIVKARAEDKNYIWISVHHYLRLPFECERILFQRQEFFLVIPATLAIVRIGDRNRDGQNNRLVPQLVILFWSTSSSATIRYGGVRINLVTGNWRKLAEDRVEDVHKECSAEF